MSCKRRTQADEIESYNPIRIHWWIDDDMEVLAQGTYIAR